ncbi:MAG TPA: hypothetical protein VIB79_30890 [Candidatus Binatia bacterium]
MSGESVERLMDIILQMRINLQTVTATFLQQTDEIREQLSRVFTEETKALDGCLRRIDGTLQECAEQIDYYRQLYASLAVMRKKLIQLGAEPIPLPAPILPERMEEIIDWRLSELKGNGKI